MASNQRLFDIHSVLWARFDLCIGRVHVYASLALRIKKDIDYLIYTPTDAQLSVESPWINPDSTSWCRIRVGSTFIRRCVQSWFIYWSEACTEVFSIYTYKRRLISIYFLRTHSSVPNGRWINVDSTSWRRIDVDSTLCAELVYLSIGRIRTLSWK